MPKLELTKVERKTILSKGFFYVLFIFFFSDQMVNGAIWFKFIPWLYILGFLGKHFFSKPYLTILFVAFTTFSSLVIRNFGLTSDIYIITINSVLMVVLGIISGHLTSNLVLSKRKVIVISIFKKIITITGIILITTIAVYINAYINGNICSYILSRNNLNKYVTATYGKNNYKIINSKYFVVNFKGTYKYSISIDGQIIKLEGKNKSFDDLNYEERLNNAETIFKQNFTKYLNDNFDEIIYININNIDAKFDYTSVKILPDKVVINILIQTRMKNLRLIYNDMVRVLNIINNYPDIDQYKVEYNLILNVKTARITDEDIKNINSTFIERSFDVEKI